jgi:glycosyltransferase involved in cell wall biosynthesis
VKGHWLLLDALGRLPDTVQLVLVTGGVTAAYARSARGRVKRALGLPLDNLDALTRDAARLGLRRRLSVTGFRRDVARVLAAADVLAFPSLAAEGFGRPIIEAMAMACPVVATDVGPSAELLGPEAGRLVPADADSLAAALDEVLRSPELRARMGEAGRRRVERCFSLDRQVAEMSAVYREAARSG